MATVLNFFYEQFFGKPVAPTKSLEGRIVCVTGANTGLGLHAAIHLAKLNPKKLIITSRSTSKGSEALKLIKDATGYEGAEVWPLDLGNFASVKAFGKRCEELERLDLLLENAGVADSEWSTTGDGWETTLQVNVIATGLLAVLVLPSLEKTAKLPDPNPSAPLRPHLTIVSSEMHFWAGFAEAKAEGSILSALNDEKSYNRNDRYMVSKLLELFIADHIAKLPAAAGVTVNVVNPSLCVSEFRRSMTGLLPRILDMMARTTESGAANLAWAGVEDTPSGAYVSVCQVKPSSSYLKTEAGQQASEKVWRELVAEWVRVAPETSKVLDQ